MTPRRPYPDAQPIENPKPGDLCFFKHGGGWRKGCVLSTPEGWLRLSVRLLEAPTPKLRRSIYWRNRSQIFPIQ